MRKIYLLVFALLISFLVCEVILHLLVKPSANSYGFIFDIELPPKIILPLDQIVGPEEAELTRNNWYYNMVVRGEKITKGDLWGILREDEFLSFTSKENAITTNGWWQSNNIGARSTESTEAVKKSPLTERILIFGNSYAQSSRVPQHETIDFYLNQMGPNIEAINLGVDGYGMAQSYLRFQTLRDKLQFDRVILFFVPKADLERDINVHRYLGLGWLSSHAINIQPRYIIEDGELTLVPSPYKNLDELVEDNRGSISDKMKNHLRKYDSFYFKFWHETIPVLDNSVLVKLIKHDIYNRKKTLLKENLMNTDSEAVQLSKRIIETMARDVKEDGGQFTLLVLPTIGDIYDYHYHPAFKKKWVDMVSYICSGGIVCLDLMDNFKRVPFERFDTGYDKTHYGPKTNKGIAEVIMQNSLN